MKSGCVPVRLLLRGEIWRIVFDKQGLECMVHGSRCWFAVHLSRYSQLYSVLAAKALDVGEPFELRLGTLSQISRSLCLEEHGQSATRVACAAA